MWYDIIVILYVCVRVFLLYLLLDIFFCVVSWVKLMKCEEVMNSFGVSGLLLIVSWRKLYFYKLSNCLIKKCEVMFWGIFLK